MNEKKIYIRKQKKEKYGLIYIFKKVYPMCFKAKPSYFIYIHILCILESTLTCGSVIINKIFYDTVYDTVLGKNSISKAFFMLSIFTGVNILGEIIEGMKNFSVDTNSKRIIGFLYHKIAEKSSCINPIDFEDPKRLDDIYKAQNGADSSAHFQFTCTMIFMFYIPYFIFMSIFLFSLKPLLVFAIFFVFVPTIISHILRTSIYIKLEDEVTPLRREYNAYRDSIISLKNVKETRNLGAFGYFKKLLIITQKSLNSKIWKANKKSNKIDVILNFLSLTGYIGVLFLLIYSLLDGSITVGAFASVFASIGTIFTIMEGMIRWNIGNLFEHFGKIRNFLRFMELTNTKNDNSKIDKKVDIELCDVSFRYPNADRDCLSNINLTIHEGETIAIVGENGAGKTTLVKILMGLYSPLTGTIKFGGKDISNIDYHVLNEGISGVFQKYQRYKMTLNDNIMISDYKSGSNIDKAVGKAGVNITDINTYPLGSETMISREFDGVDLSGGEWQRVAIARGLYRDSNIMILDEPTAAIDPIEESAIYKKFVEIAKDKTTIIITHRLGSVKIADKIIVMKDSKIVQSGTHDDLLAVKGVYADMFTTQSSWYSSKSIF